MQEQLVASPPVRSEVSAENGAKITSSTSPSLFVCADDLIRNFCQVTNQQTERISSN